MSLEGDPVAGVSVGIDGINVADGLLGQAVDGDGAADPCIADVVGDNPAMSAAIGRPD